MPTPSEYLEIFRRNMQCDLEQIGFDRAKLDAREQLLTGYLDALNRAIAATQKELTP